MQKYTFLRFSANILSKKLIIRLFLVIFMTNAVILRKTVLRFDPSHNLTNSKKFSQFSNSLFIERNETSPAFLIISKFQTNSYSLILNSIGRLSRQSYRSSQNGNQSVSKEAIR